MDRSALSSKFVCFLVSFGVFLAGALLAESAIIRLEAYVTNSINDSNGMYLVDGSVVQIVGSGDNSINPFPTLGTNLVSNLTSGDDTIIGTVTIDSSETGDDGTFSSTDFTFDDADVSYVYLRAFDSMDPLVGLLNWSFSDIFSAADNLGVAEVDFEGDFGTTNRDNFVVIPEPGSGTIMLVFSGLLIWLRLSLRGRAAASTAEKAPPSEPVDRF